MCAVFGTLWFCTVFIYRVHFVLNVGACLFVTLLCYLCFVNQFLQIPFHCLLQNKEGNDKSVNKL